MDARTRAWYVTPGESPAITYENQSPEFASRAGVPCIIGQVVEQEPPLLQNWVQYSVGIEPGAESVDRQVRPVATAVPPEQTCGVKE